jgi:putative MATE family efflux protein
MNNEIAMREESIGRLLWKFSIPAIVGMLVGTLYNIVDRIFVGRGIGTEAIAATTVAFPIMMFLSAVSVLISIGATALISIKLGEKNKEEAEKIAGNATALLIIVPIILTVFYLLLEEPILIFFGASKAVLPLAKDFTTIIMLGSVFGSIGFGMNNFIRAEGNPHFAMYTQIIGAVINGVLNYIFIFPLHMGIKGSALATVLGQMVSTVWVLGYFFTGRSSVKIHWKNLSPELSIFLKVAAVGFPPFAMQVVGSFQNLILNKALITYGGDLALSAVGIMMSIAMLIFMPVIGISQGAQPLIGYNYGAKLYGRVRETLKKAVIAATVVVVIGYIGMRLWPAEIVGIFSRDEALKTMASKALIVFFCMIPTMAFQVICSNYFQAVGKPLESTLLGLSRQLLIFIPLLLVLPHFWGIDGVWRTPPIADLCSAAVTAVFIYIEMRKLPKENLVQYPAAIADNSMDN